MIELEDIFKAASGKDGKGSARSGAGILITDKKDGKAQPPVCLDVPIQIWANGGCAVITADFGAGDQQNFKKTVNACTGFDPEEEELLLSVVPLFFDAQLTICFRGLAYFDAYETRQRRRLVFAFDNMATVVYGNEGIDYNRLKAEAAREVNDMLASIEEEIEAAEIEGNAINDEMQRALMPDFTGGIGFMEEEEEGMEEEEAGIRFSKDDYGEEEEEEGV